jgi:hypothetical protein
MPTCRTLLALFVAAIAGCAASSSERTDVSEGELGSDISNAGITENSIEGDGVLLLVNDRTVTAQTFEQKAAMPPDVAQAMVAYHTNIDGSPRWFSDLDQLDGIPGTNTTIFKALLGEATTDGYTEAPGFDPPTFADIELPPGMAPTADNVQVNKGFDGKTPNEAFAIVKSHILNKVAPQNDTFVETTIKTNHKAFTLAVGNLFAQASPYVAWLDTLDADRITMLGTISAVNPTVIMVEKAGKPTAYFARGDSNAYESFDWPHYKYPILMRARIRRTSDPAGQGVRIYYPPLVAKVLVNPIGAVITELP